jgi:hypothetical protein
MTEREKALFSDVMTFRYVVPHFPSALNNASPFQMISPGITETYGAFSLIARLPQGAAELVSDRDAIAAARISGKGLSVLPIQLPDLKSVLIHLRPRIVVVVSMTRPIAIAAADAIRDIGFPILHVTPDATNLDRAVLRVHCLSVASHWESRPELLPYARMLRDGLADWEDPLSVQRLPFQDRNHFVTEPNVAALASVGLKPIEWNEERLVAPANGPYFDAIKNSVEPIVELREKLCSRAPGLAGVGHTDLILTVPGVVKSWSEPNRLKRRQPGDAEEIKRVDRILRQIAARDTYSFQLPVNDTHDSKGEIEAIASSPAMGFIMASNRGDLAVYTSVLAVRAASSFVPVIRLPPSPNGARQELNQLAAARRQHGEGKAHKLNRLAQSLSERLSRGVPDWVLERLLLSKRIKLISDAPLEWMNVKGLPLMLRADVSRIPVTPGNLFVAEAVVGSELRIEATQFQKVLILRSFEDGDPLRNVLKRAVDVMAADTERFPDVRIVDVKTRSDVVRALNGFDGAILVYDGHGAHPKDSDIGLLSLPTEKVDPWSLREDARIPPIVVLSACDTHPLDGSHATVANGFLNAGAVTVLGTGVPVDGFRSAVLVARLLLRVGMFIPALLESRHSKQFRWSEVLPGMQRKQFVTEALRRMSQLRVLRILDDEMIDISTEVGMAIDRRGEWVATFLARIARLAGTSPVEAQELLLKHAAFVDALVYVQLGNPEFIVGVDNALPAVA